MTHSPTPPTEAPGPMPTPGPQPTVELPVETTQRVGEYRLLSILGTGGMGVVYKAFDLKLGRIVALKMLQVGISPEPDELVRFRGEAEVLGSLQHPNIVQVFDFGMHENMPYLVLEFIPGGGLDAKLANQPQPPRRAAELVEVLAHAVQVAHDKGIIHRDLKPGNVLLGADGTPKITDFGLAKRLEAGQGLTQTGAVMGTPSYMAPEQAMGKKDIGPAVDVYALGAILYECLTGRPPFKGATLPETLEQVCEDDPAPPSRLVPRLPRDLSTICLKCLHKSPGRRYASAQALADDLRNWLEGHPINARPTRALERLWRTVARRPLQAALAGCAVTLAVTLAALGVVLRDQGREAGLRAEKEEQRLLFEQERQQQQEKHQRELRAEQDYFRAEYLSSLQALDGILQLTFEGELRQVPNLGPLQARLQAYYEALVQRQEVTRFAAPDKLAEYMKKLGTVLREQGQAKKAIDLLDKADRLCAKAAESRADLAAALRHYRAQVLLQRGRAWHQLGDHARAEKDFTAGQALIRELRTKANDSIAFRRTEGELLHWHAALLADWGPSHWAKSLPLYDKAQEIHDDLAARRGATDDDLRNQSRTYGFRGDVELDLGQFDRADASYWRSHRVREKLARGGGEEPQFQLARSWSNLGGYQVRIGVLETAKYFFHKARQVREELCKNNPNMAEYQSDLGQALRTLAELDLLTLEKGAAARAQLGAVDDLLTRSMARYQELLGRETRSVDSLSSLGACHALRARLRLLQGKPDEARAELGPARQRLREALALRKVSNNDHYHLAAIAAMRAELEADSGQRRADEKEALAELRQAYDDGFRRLRSEEVLKDRAFQALRDRDALKRLLQARTSPTGPET